MPKQKSYMNQTNSVINEGVFDNLFKLLKFFPKLKDDREVQSRIANLNNSASELEAMLNAELKDMGSKKKVKIKKYGIKDFV